MKKLIASLAGLILLYLSPFQLQAQETLQIVIDPWPPFTINEGQQITGTDVDIIKAVFDQLKIPINLKEYPWKRCLLMMENREADAILGASITPERKAFLFFPDEFVSEGITVFFIKKEKEVAFTGLQDLNELRAGALLGYSYCEEIDNSPFMKKADRVPRLDQNFNKLLLDRIDFLIEVDAVGFYTAKKMGVSDQIRIIPNAYYCRGGNYLAFAKKEGHEQLAQKFSQALRVFKTSKEYRQILQQYGMESP